MHFNVVIVIIDRLLRRRMPDWLFVEKRDHDSQRENDEEAWCVEHHAVGGFAIPTNQSFWKEDAS